MNVSKNGTKSAWRDPDDAPALTGDELDNPDGRWRLAGRLVSADEGRAAFRARLGKRQVNIMLDVRVVEYFKALAGGRGYQTLINKALNDAIDMDHLEAVLRRVVREEVASASR